MLICLEKRGYKFQFVYRFACWQRIKALIFVGFAQKHVLKIGRVCRKMYICDVN